MSYLNALRLHFAGRFEAAISTVNNDPLHYDNATFRPAYQERRSGTSADTLNGWFNPRGSANWWLIGCTVTSAWLPGQGLACDDAVIGAVLADSDRSAPAKLVDLDPEQQLVSEIWGLEIRIVDSAGADLLRGRFEPAAFIDIWDRAQGAGQPGDSAAGAMYQSVLTDLSWGDVRSSSVLSALRNAAGDGLLSIKFNVDGIDLDFRSPDFLRGRVVGTIGPATAADPRHFVRGRQFLSPPQPATGSFFVPVGGLNCCVAVVDEEARRILLDLGNALPTAAAGDAPVDLGALTLQVFSPGQSLLPLGELPATEYTAADWYGRTAGIVSVPADRDLTDEELTRVRKERLVLTGTPSDGGPGTAIAEAPGGVFVRADGFVFRLDPGESVDVHLHATRFGAPHPQAPVLIVRYDAQLQPFSPLGEAPAVATPEAAIRHPVRVVTDDDGHAVVPINASDPGTPRGFIDGQVYGLYPLLEETAVTPGTPYPFDQWAFISVLVWSGFRADEPPTWFGSIQPILQQYANLYPVMDRFLDLGDYESVCANLDLLELSFGLDLRDPNSMPVTRDLSAAKRQAILLWLRQRGEDGLPLRGSPPEPVPGPTEAESTTGGADIAVPPASLPLRGGKASAASRRLVVRTSESVGPADLRAGGARP
jgi:hypothetical protein